MQHAKLSKIDKELQTNQQISKKLGGKENRVCTVKT